MRGGTMEFQDLDGKRIKLIKLDESGLEDMWEYSKNPLLYRFFEFLPQQTIEETKEYLDKLMKRGAAGNAHYWFVSLRENGKIIGSFGVHDIDWRKKDAEISYSISPDYWGQRYFEESLRTVLWYLFQEQRFHRVHATTRFDNMPSIKGLESVGFQIEGRLREFYYSHDSKRYDAVVLGILRGEFNND